jgi:hypothetical protein
MSAIDHRTGALRFDLRRSKRTGGTGVRTYRRPETPAIDNQGVERKEVVATGPHS